MQTSADKSCSLVNTSNMDICFENREPKNKTWRWADGRLPRFSLKGLTLTWNPALTFGFVGLQSQAMEGDSKCSKSRWSLPSQSKGINGVAGNCGDTGMERKLLAGVFDSRARAKPCLLAIGGGRELSRRAEFSRHCLWFRVISIGCFCLCGMGGMANTMILVNIASTVLFKILWHLME